MGENGTMIEKGPGYQVGPPRDDGTIEIMESYCVKIIGTTSKYCISSNKTLPRMITAILIKHAILILLCFFKYYLPAFEYHEKQEHPRVLYDEEIQ